MYRRESKSVQLSGGVGALKDESFQREGNVFSFLSLVRKAPGNRWAAEWSWNGYEETVTVV